MIAQIIFGTSLERNKCFTIFMLCAFCVAHFADFYMYNSSSTKKCKFEKKRYKNIYKNTFIGQIYIYRTCKII